MEETLRDFQSLSFFDAYDVCFLHGWVKIKCKAGE